MKKRIIIASLISWAFLNLYLLIAGIGYREGNIFPVSNDEVLNDYFFYDSTYEGIYDPTEFFLYVGIPVLMFYLYGYVKGTNNNKQ